MREIKFRCWNKYFKIYEDYYFEPGDLQVESLNSAFTDESVTLEQFTGLYDKNNNPIYEGDIVKGKWFSTDEYCTGIDFINVIKYHNDLCAFGFPVTYDGSFKTPIENYINLLHQCEYIEIIGNIHQNKDLLK